MKIEKLTALAMVLMMCLTPVAGMTNEVSEVQEIPQPDETMTATMIYGWVNESGVGMENITILFEDTDTPGIINSNTTDGTGYYEININVTHPGHWFTVYGISNFTYLYQSNWPFNEGGSQEFSFNVNNVTEPRDIFVRGIISDSLTGLPMAGINLTAISDPGPSAYLNSTQTNASGYYNMGFIPNNYRMGLDADGYEDWVEQFQPSPGEILWRNITLEPLNSTLRGFITNVSGPIDGAQVSFNDPAGIYYTGNTNSTGYYEFNTTRGTKSVGARFDGHYYTAKAANMILNGETWLNFTLVEYPPDVFTVKGFITDFNTSAPVIGANVWLNTANRTWDNANNTDGTGYYEISGPAEELTFTGMNQSYWQNVTTVTGTPGGVEWINMTLSHQNEWFDLQGQVLFDGVPTDQARVVVTSGNWYMDTNTDPGGNYFVSNIPVGLIEISCYNQQWDGEDPISTLETVQLVGHDSDVITQDFDLYALAMDSILIGKVNDSASSAPLKDVFFYLSNGDLFSGIGSYSTGGGTDFTGTYELGVPSCELTYLMMADGYYNEFNSVDTSVKEWNRHNVSMDPIPEMVTIMGYVTDMTNGQPLIGIEVSGSQSLDWMIWSEANATGYYEIDVPLGDVSLGVGAREYGYYDPGQLAFKAQSGQDIWFNISLRPLRNTVFLSGRVNESDDSSIVGINVTARIGSRDFTAQTDINGNYSMSIPVAECRVWARGPGYGMSNEENLWMQEWQSSQFDITMDPAKLWIEDVFSYWTEDEDNDGKFDWLHVNATINVTTPEEYGIEGELMAHRFVSNDGGGGSGMFGGVELDENLNPGLNIVQLRFSGANIRLSEMDGYYVNIQVRDGQTGNTIDEHGFSTAQMGWDDFEIPDIMVEDPMYEWGVIDTDYDGLYNILLYNITVNVSAPGNYSFFTMLNNMVPRGNDNDNEIGMQMRTEELDVGIHTIPFSFTGTSIYKGGYHLGAMTVLIFNGSIDMENGNIQTYGFNYLPYNYTHFQNYPIDSWVNGTVTDVGGTPIDNLTVGIYNITSKTWNETLTDASGYYELGGWEGEWLLYMNDEGQDSSVYQSNMTVIQMVSGIPEIEDRGLEYTVPDQIIRTITFTDWNTTRVEEIIYIESDNETIRFEMDFDMFGNGDGFMSEAEADTLMSFISGAVQWDPDSNETMLVDNIWYDMVGGTNTVDLGIVGSYTTKELVYIHQIANFTSFSGIPGAANHSLELNVTYDDVNIGLFTGGNVSLMAYVQLPGAWGHTSAIQTNVSISGTNYVTINPGGIYESNRSEWINITAQDGQPVTTGNLFGNVTLFGKSEHYGVTVSVYNYSNGTPVTSKPNDINGEYQIYGLEGGSLNSYNITFSKPGYESVTFTNIAIINGSITWVVDVELYPLPPTIFHTQSIFTIENNTAVLLIYADISDDAVNVTLQVNDVSSADSVIQMYEIATTGTYNATIPMQLTAGTISYNITAENAAGNTTTTSNYIIDVYERVPPVLNNLQVTFDPTEYNDPTNISIDITDNYWPVVNVWINVTAPGGTTYYNNFNGSGAFYVNSTYLEIGVYNYVIWANDSFGNADQVSGTFVVGDTNSPAIIDPKAAPPLQEIGDAVNVTANLTDLSGIAEAKVNITDPDGVMTNSTMLQGSGDLYYFESNYSLRGSHSYTIWVTDNNGLVSSVSGNFVMEDTTPVDIITVATDPATAELGETVNFTAELEDMGGIGNVYLVLENETATIWNETLEGNTTHYWYEFTILETGSFDLILWTEDMANNTNSTTISIDVEDTAGPTITMGTGIPSTRQFGDDIALSIDATDLAGIDSVNMHLEFPDSTFINVTAQLTRAEYVYVHEVDAIGDHTYTFWVVDSSGNTASVTGTFTGTDTQDPVANAGPSQNVMVGTEVTLDASLSSDNNDIENYSWSLNDNGLKRRYGKVAYYTFNTPGEYEITLTVTDPSDNSDTSTTWVNVSAITGTGTVTGTVLDADGIPIEGASVYVDNYPTIENTTDSLGRFILEDVPTGPQTIVANKDGIRTSKNITVLQDQSVPAGTLTIESTSDGEPSDDGGGPAGLLILIILLVVAVLVGYFLATRKKEDTPPPAPMEESTTIIDEIFYMYNDGRLIKHFTRRLKPDMDEDILSSMLVAVQEFVKDSFGSEEGMLDEMRFGRFQAMMGRGEHIIIAAVIIGDETQPFKPQIQKCIKDIEDNYQDRLADWDGDVSRINGSYKYVMNLIDGQYEDKPPEER